MAKFLNSILFFFLNLSEAKVVAPLLTIAEVHALISRGATLLSLGLIFLLYTMFIWSCIPYGFWNSTSGSVFTLSTDIDSSQYLRKRSTIPSSFTPFHKVFSASRSPSLHVLAITEVKAQKRCTAILDPTGCVLVDCQKQCLEKYNGNGLCTGGVTGPMNCVCVFNCSSN